MGSRQIVLVSTAGISVLNAGILWREAKTKRLFSQCIICHNVKMCQYRPSIYILFCSVRFTFFGEKGRSFIPIIRAYQKAFKIFNFFSPGMNPCIYPDSSGLGSQWGSADLQRKQLVAFKAPREHDLIFRKILSFSHLINIIKKDQLR